MNSWFKSIFAGLAMTGIVFLFYQKVLPSNKSGLYKVHYVLGSNHGIQNKKGITEEIPGEIPAIIKKRISELGYNSIIRIMKNNSLDILVENVQDTVLLCQVVAQNNNDRKIELREVYTLDEIPALFPTADKAAGKVFASAKREETGIYSIISPLVADEIDGENVFRSALGSVNKKDTIILTRILQQPEVLHHLPADLQFYYGVLTIESAISITPDDLYLYAIRTRGEKAIIQNDDIESAEMKYNSDNQPGLFFKLNDIGTRKWKTITHNNKGRYIAMILDGIVTAAPKIYDTNQESWIMMSGRFTIDEVMTLTQQLNSKLPANDLAIIKEEILSKKTSNRGKLILILILTFAVVAGLVFLILNALKNR